MLVSSSMILYSTSGGKSGWNARGVGVLFTEVATHSIGRLNMKDQTSDTSVQFEFMLLDLINASSSSRDKFINGKSPENKSTHRPDPPAFPKFGEVFDY